MNKTGLCLGGNFIMHKSNLNRQGGNIRSSNCISAERLICRMWDKNEWIHLLCVYVCFYNNVIFIVWFFTVLQFYHFRKMWFLQLTCLFNTMLCYCMWCHPLCHAVLWTSSVFIFQSDWFCDRSFKKILPQSHSEKACTCLSSVSTETASTYSNMMNHAFQTKLGFGWIGSWAPRSLSSGLRETLVCRRCCVHIIQHI